ncbi:MAG TPA: phosphoribosyl-AMP cyclohydrolase [Candidatus Omnitrophica bacterium]|nr:phosphoribosyl-AMP cyclohydrolase [Candidatus Omnitrophota bacterium]
MNLIEKLKYNSEGLIPAIIQDKETNEVLMMAYMNKEAIQKTIETEKTHFYSRSRKKLWKKGETSGHIQTVKEILIDCDMDTLLIKVAQIGGACHKGYRSCFFRKVEGKFDNLKIVAKKIFNPDKVYE